MKKILAILLLAPGLVGAAEWKGEGELGFTSTSGNTDSDTLNTKLSLSKEHDKWKHTGSLQVLKSSTDNVDSADSKIFQEKSRYKFLEKTYAFVGLRYEDDKFSGFDYQSSVSLGFGHEFLKGDVHSLDASLGLGYRKTKDTATQQTESEGIIKAEADYGYVISKHASFSEKILVESGDSNTHSESETGLKMKINASLSSKITYSIKRNSDVPAGTEKTDKITAITLVYGF
ncbi:MAG: DUF481 domain-containing protein [Gammaproteobacteria bacterium]|nr:DUF481 domain-containing protein [Gammaproteobacteria bacterium]